MHVYASFSMQKPRINTYSNVIKKLLYVYILIYINAALTKLSLLYSIATSFVYVYSLDLFMSSAVCLACIIHLKGIHTH